MSLIPEKPIVISPSLAATLGLEEAVLLQLLQECIAHGDTLSSSGFNWVTISGQKLLSLTPFWREEDIRRLSASLHEKGLLLIGGGAFSAHQDFRFAFNEVSATQASTQQASPRQTGGPQSPTQPSQQYPPRSANHWRQLAAER